MNKIIILLTVALLSISGAAFAQTTSTVTTDSTSKSSVDTDAQSRTIVISPPPSAISPGVGSSSSDLCTVGVSGAVQTQILGLSTGEMVRDENCERLKISKTLYDMGMKVAAVALMCQTRTVYDAMKFAGTPCPINNPVTGEGLIGKEATAEWRLNPKKVPAKQPAANMNRGVFLEKLVSGIIGIMLLAVLVI